VVIASLRELLGYAGLAPPYVLVGHSIGGLYANLFARLHPPEVAAVLFVEATHPRDQEMLQEHKTRLGKTLETMLSLPQRLFRANLHSEIDSVHLTVREIAAAGPFPPVPVSVITGDTAPPNWLMPAAALQARLSHQQDLARLSPQGEHVIAAHSGHFPQLTEPALVQATLRRLIERSAVTAWQQGPGAAVLRAPAA